MVDYIRSAFVEEPIVAIREGKKGQPQTLVKGGEYAYGEIVFADNPTAADTITLNGIYVEFTAAASDATAAGTVGDPLLVNIKASLALTLDELVIVTEAATHAELIVATYSEDGVDTFEITYDTLTATGNAYTLAASADTPSGATLTGGEAAPAVSNDTDSVDLQLTDTRDQYFTLASGVPFQEKTIVITAKSTGNAVVSYNTANTSTFDADSEYLKLQFLDGEWRVIASTTTDA